MEKLKTFLINLFQKQIIRYLFVGGLSAASLFLFSNFLDICGLSTSLSAGGGWLLSVLVSYFGHKKITFNSKSSHKKAGMRFIILLVINALYTQGIMFLFHDYLGYHYSIASLIVTVTMPLISYPIQKFFVFKNGKEQT